MKERLDYIDIAKGFAILAVIVGHYSDISLVDRFIWSWHMPLFFILSGYFLPAGG